MTIMGLDYLEHQEQVRHNQAMELETNRANLAKEQETALHNRNVEYETFRSNTTRERQTQQTLDETARHNLALESIQSVQAQAAKDQAQAAKDKASAALTQAEAAKSQATTAFRNMLIADSAEFRKTVELDFEKVKEGNLNAYRRDTLSKDYASIGTNLLTGSLRAVTPRIK